MTQMMMQMENPHAEGEEFLNVGIRTLIQKYPAVGDILKKYNFICGMCSVGICRLAEIVRIYGLSEAESAELIYQIRRAISPETKIEGSKVRHDLRRVPYEPSPSLKILVDKHPWIRTLLDLVPSIVRIVTLRVTLLLTSKIKLERRLFRPFMKGIKKRVS